MNRLAKKCVIASSIMHGTLVVILLVGPAFFRSPDAPARRDGRISHEETILILPAREFETSAPRRDDSYVPRTPQASGPTTSTGLKPQESGWKRSKNIEPNLNPTTRHIANLKASHGSSIHEDTAFDDYSGAIGRITNGASSSLEVKALRKPSGDIMSYPTIRDALISQYWRAWLIPAEAADEASKVLVTVTLRRDGAVLAARIQKGSGNSALDTSVQYALKKVTFVAAFPESVKGAEKTFQLEFDPKAKRMME